MINESIEIDCECHGKNTIAAVCGHLVKNNGAPLGFIENSSELNDLQGWCYACEFVFIQENDKTERFKSFCNHSIVCSKCYLEIRNTHII